MSKRLLALCLCTSMLFFSCSKDNPTTEVQQQTPAYNINNGEDITSSISMEGVGVVGVTAVSDLKASEENSEVINIALEQIAMVEPPIVDGEPVRANHVDVEGDYAYVAYTKEGPSFLGGIQIIDISDKYNPVVVEEMTSSFVDINALYVENNILYYTGAFANPALGFFRPIVGKVNVFSGRFHSFDESILNGQAGVDVLPYENLVLALSGSEGAIAAYDTERMMTLNPEIEAEYPDLRSAAYSNGKLVALSGTEGLLVLNSELQTEKKISLSPMTDASKRTISFYGDKLLVSEGQNGVGLYDLESSSEIARLPINILPENEVADQYKVTNAVTTADDYILMANGGAGFGISKLDDNYALTQEGIIEIDGSVNYVKAKDDYVFVASGTGFRILRMSKPEIAQQTDFLTCSDYDTYSGNKNLNVNSGAVESFSGSATLKHLNVGGILNFCGALNIEKSTNINSNGEFNMSGSLAVGQVGKNEDLNINSKSTLRIEGSLTVYGNLNLNSGATLEFVGNNSTIHVYGDVRKGSDISIIGDYTDTSNKL
ncbi:hypothetical protein RM553_03985 [Zunongwangia sp. F363]|uniref:LVIVD repeat-containing protein n=1 Tax=Autumnicola tepida TaxID=3075595 RepID=A0ABU3C6P5_9FLAO|nr:hypothetical protein [Zunongwangia sp. F363]MDT0641984.1 hypothetical protein [Zunongwangia sp. F363]